VARFSFVYVHHVPLEDFSNVGTLLRPNRCSNGLHTYRLYLVCHSLQSGTSFAVVNKLDLLLSLLQITAISGHFQRSFILLKPLRVSFQAFLIERQHLPYHQVAIVFPASPIADVQMSEGNGSI